MAKSVRLTDAVAGYLLGRRGPCNEKTLSWYRQKLLHLCLVCEQEYKVTLLKDVTVAHLRLFIERMKETEADANNPHKPTREGVFVRDVTVKGYAQVIKSFFSWCVKEDLIKKNPSANLDNPKVGHYIIKSLTQDHIRSMLAACDTSTMIGFRDYVIMLVLLDTGVRVAELCSLTLEHVHLEVLDEAFIKVMGKGRKEREIGLSSEVAQKVWKYIHVYRHPKSEAEQRLFISRYGVPLTANGIEQLVHEAAKRASLTGARFSPHTFRHTFARMFLENGGDIYKLSLLLGHSSVVVTENYLRDFYSRNARQGQSKHSPVANMDVGKLRKGFAKGSKDVR